MKRAGSLLLVILVLGTVIATTASLLWPILPRAAAIIPIAPQFAALAALLGIVALLTRHRILATLCILAAAWNLHLIWPEIAPRASAAPANLQPTLKVVGFNLRWENPTLDKTADYLMASGADVIGLIEATPRSKAALARLKEAYPYSIDCVGMAYKCQTMLFSRYPLKNAAAGPIDGRYPYVAVADIVLPSGAVTVAVTHLQTPFRTEPREPLVLEVADAPVPVLPDAPATEQSAQAANLANFLQKQPADLVLLGDFNSAPWSPVQQALRAATGLDNRGSFLPSWPSWAWPVFRLSLDQVFVRGRIKVVQIGLGPDIGSDHLPVVAELALTP